MQTADASNSREPARKWDIVMRWISAIVLCLSASLAMAGDVAQQERKAVMMSLDVEKDLSRRGIAMWAGGATIDTTIFAPDYANHQEPLADGGTRTIDLAAWVAVVEANHQAFPDLSVEIMMQVAEGDRVATHWRFSATQTGTYEGQAATGKNVSWTGIQIDRFADGKIAESWVVWDKYTMFKQLDLIP